MRRRGGGLKEETVGTAIAVEEDRGGDETDGAGGEDETGRAEEGVGAEEDAIAEEDVGGDSAAGERRLRCNCVAAGKMRTTGITV